MDIIGPLQVTDRGNQYIVALTDHFTKFPVAKVIPCKSSEEVARFMYETICIFGAFDSLITDQGREFINFVLDILTDRFNINHRISSAYHPQTNGQWERDNRTLKDTLVKITDNDDWDELLPAALFAYRTSVHKYTQFSPFLALYGEQAKLPFDVTGDANEQDLNEEIMDIMKGIHEEVKNKIGENISRAQKKQKEYYDSRRAYDHGFRIGDKVLIINAARVHRMGGKMAPRFVGPYEVISVLPKGRLQLKNTKSGKILKNLYNISNVKLFYDRTQDNADPSHVPHADPSHAPQADPSYHPQADPFHAPQADHSYHPQADPSHAPQADPSYHPQADPSHAPHADPSHAPQADPSYHPQDDPSCQPPLRMKFHPVDGAWQKDRASSLNFPRLFRRHPSRESVEVDITATPLDPVSVKGDGNCFFRSVSFVLLGTESKYKEFRKIICNWIEKNDKRFYGTSARENYVATSNMKIDRTWATEVEIFAAATLLDTPVYVFTREAPGRQPQWLKYGPVWQSASLKTDRAIYIMNLGHHFAAVFCVTP
ncbi:hypothetical protein ACOMHN_038313 [Nucella lapillus]